MRLDDKENLRSAPNIDWEKLSNKTVYVTGATGLLGASLVDTILFIGNIKVTVQVRNEDKARRMFADKVDYVICDLLDKPVYHNSVDYIIHCANPTSSRFFVDYPVETINTAVIGTKNILEFAKEKRVKGVVFLSTMEVFGTPERGHKVCESECGSFDSAVVRNCYPLSKQLCENLCIAYKTEYDVPAKIIRLTQTFGPGVNYNDGRVFAEFARCVVEKRDIILKTKGETERSYLYIAEAISAILIVLLEGKNGEIYTAANEDTYCSILEMAQIVAKLGRINVLIQEQDINKFGYNDTIYMDLDVSKLKSLGWKTTVGLKEIYERMIDDWGLTE